MFVVLMVCAGVVVDVHVVDLVNVDQGVLGVRLAVHRRERIVRRRIYVVLYFSLQALARRERKEGLGGRDITFGLGMRSEAHRRARTANEGRLL